MLALISPDMRPDSETPATAFLREEHRAIEPSLDRLETMLAAWKQNPLPQFRPLVRKIWPAVRLHDRNEEGIFFAAVRREFAAIVEKMEQQHADSAELGTHLADLLEIPEPSVRELSDMRKLGRRFHAITQHNFIEEERDLFRLADGLLSRNEQEGLYWMLLERRRADETALNRDRST